MVVLVLCASRERSGLEQEAPVAGCTFEGTGPWRIAKGMRAPKQEGTSQRSFSNPEMGLDQFKTMWGSQKDTHMDALRQPLIFDFQV